jgi:hypothetical protein
VAETNVIALWYELGYIIPIFIPIVMAISFIALRLKTQYEVPRHLVD